MTQSMVMMMIDGVSGAISNDRHKVYIDFIVRLATCANRNEGAILSELNLRQGEGMCMGYHHWREGDFGENSIAIPRSDSHSDPRNSVRE